MPASLKQKIKKYKGVYVRNMTADPPTVISITFKIPGRDPQLLKIPPGPYPYEIYPSRVSEQALLQGGEQFTHFVETGQLKYVGSRKARAILKDPEVQAEMKAALSRVNDDAALSREATLAKRAADRLAGTPENAVAANSEYVAGPSIAPRIDLMPDNPVQRMLKGHPANPLSPSRAAHQLSIAGGDSNVAPRVLGIMSTYDPATESNTLKHLKGMASMLSEADLHWIEGKSAKGSRLHQWVRKLKHKRGHLQAEL